LEGVVLFFVWAVAAAAAARFPWIGATDVQTPPPPTLRAARHARVSTFFHRNTKLEANEMKNGVASPPASLEALKDVRLLLRPRRPPHSSSSPSSYSSSPSSNRPPLHSSYSLS
jgi:hypothetical protein